ncbi:MAG TPA: hypothetical protein VF808_00795 [Ktedonobacterales bacterium]
MAATPSKPVAPPPPVHHGPMFSWRAFIADQAISILAYLGGFLLLIATLTFEVTASSGLDPLLKLGGVTFVYVVFGALGIGLRRFHALRTVSRVYLGVFALATPLEALAVYLFALRGQGLSAQGMVCIAAAYAAVVYIALAARTRFVTYAYLGWASVIGAIVTVPLWAGASFEWWMLALAVSALVLLAPRVLSMRWPEGAIAWMSVSAMAFSAVISSLAALSAIALFIGRLAVVEVGAAAYFAQATSALLALALTSLVLTALAFAWFKTLPTLASPAVTGFSPFTAWLVAAFAAMSVCSIALAMGASAEVLVYTLAGAALAEGVFVLVLRRRLAAFSGLVIGIQALAMSLAGVGVLMGAPLTSPHIPMLSACLAGFALGAIYAARGVVGWPALWGVGGGVFALIGAFSAFESLVPSTLLNAQSDAFATAWLELPSLYAGLALVFTAIGVLLKFVAPAFSGARNLRTATHSTALVGSAVTSLLLVAHTGPYAAAVLGVFAVTSIIVGRIERWPIPSGVLGAFFGIAAVLIFIINASTGLAIVAVGPAIAVAGLVWYFGAGRMYAAPVYLVALVAAPATSIRLTQPFADIPPGIAHFALGPAGISALAVSLLMALAALRERSAWWQSVPAAVSLLSLAAANSLWPVAMLTLALACAGTLSRLARGRTWGIPWHGAAAISSVVAVLDAILTPQGSPASAVTLALAFMTVAWLVAWQEDLPWLTWAAAPYAVVAFFEATALPVRDVGKFGILVALTLLIVGFGALARARLGRWWGIPLYGIAAIGSAFTLVMGFSTPALTGHLEIASLIFGAAAWVIAWQEREPWLSLGVAPYAVVTFVNTTALPIDVRLQFTILVGLTLLIAGFGALARTGLGRFWGIPLYGIAATGSVFALVTGFSTPGLAGYLEVAALVFGAAAWLIAWREGQPWFTAGATSYAVAAFVNAGALPIDARLQFTILLALTLLIVGFGALARARLGRWWGIPLYGIAAIGSAFTVAHGLAHPAEAWYVEVSALVLAVVAWLVAWQERKPLISSGSVLYALVAFVEVPQLHLDIFAGLGVFVVLTLTFAGLGALSRVKLGRSWALTFYVTAVIGSLFPIPQAVTMPSYAGLFEGVLLVYAAVALGIALIEDNKWAVFAPALYASGAALAQPDGRWLLPLALALAALAFTMSRWRGGRWALPLYGAGAVAALASTWQSHQSIPSFEPIALGVLGVTTWLLAALESRPDALIIAYVFAGLAIPALGEALGWQEWTSILSFAGLSWGVGLVGLVWARLPWLRRRSGSWLQGIARSADTRASLEDPRIAGRWISRGAGLLIAFGAASAGIVAPDAFAAHTSATLVAAVTLASLSGILFYEGALTGWRPAAYVAIETLALAVTWQIRWFGVTNLQALIVAPGSAQLVVGALLPVDRRLRAPAWLSQAFSIGGALILTIPTFTQSVTEPRDAQWIYILTLALEALVLTLIAVGLRNRVLALTASAFVGVAAIRGAVLAVTNGSPIALIIGAFALALMGLATWLSLRARHHNTRDNEGSLTVSDSVDPRQPPPLAGS